MTEGTARNLPEQCRPQNIVFVEPDRPFRLDDWIIEPVSVPHDTADPICFTVQSSSIRVGVITDLGHVTHRVTQQLSTLDAAVLEFNHDERMLEYGHYPQRLKERVRGPYGHLSIMQAADLIHVVVEGVTYLQHVVLAHLSADNNTIDKAYLACQSALNAAGLGQTQIHVASQQTPLKPVTIYKEQRVSTPAPPKLRRIANRPDQPTLFPDLAGSLPLFLTLNRLCIESMSTGWCNKRCHQYRYSRSHPQSSINAHGTIQYQLIRVCSPKLMAVAIAMDVAT